MPKHAWLAYFLPLALPVAACGSITTAPSGDAGGDAADAPADTGGDAPAVVTVAQSCTDLDTSLCNALAACSTFVLQLSFGDLATCVSRNDLACTIEQSPTG